MLYPVSPCAFSQGIAVDKALSRVLLHVNQTNCPQGGFIYTTVTRLHSASPDIAIIRPQVRAIFVASTEQLICWSTQKRDPQADVTRVVLAHFESTAVEPNGQKTELLPSPSAMALNPWLFTQHNSGSKVPT